MISQPDSFHSYILLEEKRLHNYKMTVLFHYVMNGVTLLIVVLVVIVCVNIVKGN